MEDPDVLELRIHGVNNSSPQELLDLPAPSVELVMGDTLGSFWRAIPDEVAKIPDGARGHVPDGIRREAYSWGGMVRTVPSIGGTNADGTPSTIAVIASIGARIGYVLLIPFALANAAQWTWRLPPAADDERGSRIPAGLTRVFGLLLTLLYTTTAATLALDLGAAQCAAAASLCAPAASVFGLFAGWSGPARLALFAVIPVLAAGLLWLLSNLSRQRYDVLPGMAGHKPGAHTLVDEAPAPTALLASPGFWSNRITRHLAHAHFAGAIFLTVILAGAHAAFRWNTPCVGLGHFTVCIGGVWNHEPFLVGFLIAVAGILGLVTTVVVVFLLPTTAVTPEELRTARGSAQGATGDTTAPKTQTWPARWGGGLLAASIGLFVILEGYLLMSPFNPAAASLTRLYGAGATPLILVTVAAVIAVSGVFWRGLGRHRGAASDRTATAWNGCGPAVFMMFALVAAVAMSAIVTVTVGGWLNGSAAASALISDGRIAISVSYVALGSCIVVGLVVFLLVVAPFLGWPTLRAPSNARGTAWKAPMDADADHLVPDGTSVLPPSRTTVFSWIQRQRSVAARIHMGEPVAGIGTIVLGAAAVGGIAWAWIAYAHPGAPLWNAAGLGAIDVVRTSLSALMAALAWIGVAFVGVIAASASRQSARPAGVIWDIMCFLPRTGHPFGPPAYAERAVPEIAGRLYEWVTEQPGRRAVLAGHSMGAVLSVAAVALLGSSPQTRGALDRIGLLTFGAQLRVFFGRFFPELLGPAALGTQPSHGPILRGGDPWAHDFDRPETPEDNADGHLRGTLLAKPGVPWVNLWRATDMLGWPVDNAHPNSVDRYAEELDVSGYMAVVGGHNGYYRVPAFQNAVLDLAELPKPPEGDATTDASAPSAAPTA